MNYLKKLRIVLQEKSKKEAFCELKERLAEAGIAVSFEEEGLPEEEILEEGSQQENRERQGSLFICDGREEAQKLKRAGAPVLIFFHEKNRGTDFSGFPYAMEEPQELEATYFERVYRRLKGLPWEIAETERCFVRETTEEDVESFYEIYSHPEITKFMENLYPEPERERLYIREYIEKIYRLYEYGIWTVVEKEEGRVIGRAGFCCREGYENPELGYTIGVPWQHQGLALEVCSALLQYGRSVLGFRAVNAMVAPDNAASLRLCEKLGFMKREIFQEQQKSYIRLEKVLKDF